ncbi:MAG: antitoxin family protein [Myxococcota bacterium]
MTKSIEAFFDGQVFRPIGTVALPQGTRVKLEVQPLDAAHVGEDLADVDAAYRLIDTRYPLANVRLAFASRDELHDR